MFTKVYLVEIPKDSGITRYVYSNILKVSMEYDISYSKLYRSLRLKDWYYDGFILVKRYIVK